MNISFDAYFKTAPPTIVFQPDSPRFTIVTANVAYLQATHAKLEELIGQNLLALLPENSSASKVDDALSLQNSLAQALFTKQQQILPGQKYQISVSGISHLSPVIGG